MSTYITPETLDRIAQIVDQNLPAGTLVEEGLAHSKRTAREWVAKFKEGGRSRFDPIYADNTENEEPHDPDWHEDNFTGITSSAGETIKTPEALLKAAQVDMSVWEKVSSQVRTWQVYRKKKSVHLSYDEGKADGTIRDDGEVTVKTMWGVRVWLKRREAMPYEQAIEALLQRMKQASPKRPASKQIPGAYLLLPMFTDTHFGRAVPDRDNAPERTATEMIATAHAMVEHTKQLHINVGKILFPIGNDALNADTLDGRTTRGTWQEMSGNLRDAATAASYAHIQAIEILSEIAPVYVVVVEGNHDRMSSHWLGLVLQAYFSRNANVTVDIDRGPRQYFRWGKTLIGMEHGDRAKPRQLGLLMAHEAADEWSNSKYRVFLRGHFHHETELIHTVDGVGTIQVITYPAFCPRDEWEMIMGYMGGHRRADVRFFHEEQGPSLTFPVFVDELNIPT